MPYTVVAAKSFALWLLLNLLHYHNHPSLEPRTCGHHLAQLGIAVDCHTDDVIVVLQIETLPFGERLIHHARSRSRVDHRPVWRQEQVLPGVKPAVAKDELQREVLGVRQLHVSTCN